MYQRIALFVAKAVSRTEGSSPALQPASGPQFHFVGGRDQMLPIVPGAPVRQPEVLSSVINRLIGQVVLQIKVTVGYVYGAAVPEPAV